MCPLVFSGLKCAAKIHLELQFCVAPWSSVCKGNGREQQQSAGASLPPSLCHSHSLPASLRRQTPHFPSILSRSQLMSV